MNKTLLSLAVFSSLMSGCVQITPFETSRRESFQYTDLDVTLPVAQEGTTVNQSPDSTYVEQPFADAVPVPTIEPPSDTYYPTPQDQYNTSGYYGYQPTPAPIETPMMEMAPTQALSGGDDKLQEAKAAEKNEEFGSMMVLLEEAASQGNGEAYYLLAKHYMKGDIVPVNQDLASIHLEQANQLGHPEALRVLAWNELKKPTTGDLSLGRSMMEQAAAKSVRAKREYGLLLINVYQPNLNDPDLGRFYLNEAYQAGDADAAYQLYLLSKKSGADSLAHLEAAANAGQPQALVARAKRRLTAGDKANASSDMEKAALSGDVSAMYAYANGLSLGTYGGSGREAQAYVWFSLCAERGNSAAQNELKALEGTKKLTDRQGAGTMAKLISDTKKSINTWNPNG
jgi:TPR repeat protein